MRKYLKEYKLSQMRQMRRNKKAEVIPIAILTGFLAAQKIIKNEK